MIYDSKILGRCCKMYRMTKGYTQSEVASATGYSVKNISAFETGRNDNGLILLWYVVHGLTKWDYFAILAGVKVEEDVEHGGNR